MAHYYASLTKEVSKREIENMARVRKIAPQGMVLLENKGCLPLDGMKEAALFGNGARHTVKGGTGSGDVNSRTVVNIEQGLLGAGVRIATTAWLDRYDEACREAKSAYFAAIRKDMQENGQSAIMELFTNPYHDPDVVPIMESDAAETDGIPAIYILSRNSGEGKDRADAPGDYELTETEKQNIAFLASHYEKLVVVLNVGGVIDTKFLREQKGIGAVLLMSQAGNIGGDALADVLLGSAYPAGHLAATWPEHYSDYPSADTFGARNGDIDDEYYNEDIFVGYRYFDTFGVKPAYPFGYGLSYTDFAVTDAEVRAEKDKITVTAKVTNTGTAYAGKESLQVYVSQPAGRLPKAYQVLAGFAKTGELAPGACETVTVTFSMKALASYDEAKAAWILEGGTYLVRVGTHSRNTHIAAKIVLPAETTVRQLKNLFRQDEAVKTISTDGAAPYTYDGEEAEKAAAKEITLDGSALSSPAAVYSGEPQAAGKADTDAAITFEDVVKGRFTLDDLVSQLTREEMAVLCVGTARGIGVREKSVVGAASAAVPGAAGDTTSTLLEKRHVPNLILADGPAGLRLARYFTVDRDGTLIPELSENGLPDLEEIMGAMARPERPEGAVTYYQYCTAIPIATLLAQTFDRAVIEEAGDIVGGEMEEMGVDLWLAPGMNIQRNPLCGRNFEYYSEDPFLAGECAAADTRGVQRHPGKGTTIKHFACNNQEDNRMHNNAHVTERALREIYLRGFEYCVEEAQPHSVMTSYNLINGVHSANNYDLLTSALRDEWGFAGMVMTDWGTTGSIEMNPGVTFKYGCSSASGCIKAGNDLTMPGSQQDVDDILASDVTRGELEACAKRVLQAAVTARKNTVK